MARPVGWVESPLTDRATAAKTAVMTIRPTSAGMEPSSPPG